MYDTISCIAGVDGVVSSSAVDSLNFSGRLVDFEIAFSLDDYSIVTIPATYNGIFSIGVNQVVSITTAQLIRTCATGDVVVACASIDEIIALVAPQDIIAISAFDPIITFAAKQPIVCVRTNESFTVLLYIETQSSFPCHDVLALSEVGSI